MVLLRQIINNILSMKKILLFLLTCTLLASCGVNEAEYNEIKAERDSLLVEIDRLKNGEERLMNFIKLHYNKNEYIKAYDYLIDLKKYHPESELLVEYDTLYAYIENKAAVVLDSINKVKNDSIRISNLNALGIWSIGNFVDEFGEATDKKYVYTNVYGTFSNTSTSNSKLRVYFQADNYADDPVYFMTMKFDEYNKGVYEDIRYRSIKILNRAQRKVYTKDWNSHFIDKEGNEYTLNQILENEGIYEFSMELRYGTKYNFSIDTKNLNNALIKAGIKEID